MNRKYREELQELKTKPTEQINGMIMTQEHIKKQIASIEVINRYMMYYTT